MSDKHLKIFIFVSSFFLYFALCRAQNNEHYYIFSWICQLYAINLRNKYTERIKADFHFNDWKASAVPLYHTFRQKESLSFVKSSLRYCSGDRSSNHQCPGTVPALFREVETIRYTAIPCPASEISLRSGCSGKKQQTVILQSSDQRKPLSSHQKPSKQYNYPPDTPLSEIQPSFPGHDP